MSLNFTKKDRPQPEHLIPENKDATVPLFLENSLFQVCNGTKLKLWSNASYPGSVSNHFILLHIAAAFHKLLKPHMSFHLLSNTYHLKETKCSLFLSQHYRSMEQK